MPIKINNDDAKAILRKAAQQAEPGQVNIEWAKKIEHLSRLCHEGVSKTHIAFLGTVILAKSLNRSADLFAIKPKLDPANPHAFSARTLCHGVLVPMAAELGMSLGVTGREPLNNQPYFRMTRLDDGTPVHAGGKAAFDYMLTLVRELEQLPDEASAQAALAAFVAVRRLHQRRYSDFGSGGAVTAESLIAAIKALVKDDSEGGRRAQAVVAGLMDTFAGEERVESGRVNDPSRKHPGDVCIRSASDPGTWEKAFEVRDKPVSASDIQIFAKKCIDMGVREAALVMVAERQNPVDEAELKLWANGFGIGLTLFSGWDLFVEQALFWSELPKPLAATKAATFIDKRLRSVEATPEAIVLWQSLIPPLNTDSPKSG